eukprot:3238250-Pyramimonas_sp.AAC.1
MELRVPMVGPACSGMGAQVATNNSYKSWNVDIACSSSLRSVNHSEAPTEGRDLVAQLIETRRDNSASNVPHQR